MNTGEHKFEPAASRCLRQRRMLRDALISHEVERANRLFAELQTDALLDRVRQPEPANFCAPVDQDPPRRSVALGWVIAYAAMLIGSVAMAMAWNTDTVQHVLTLLRGTP